MKNWETIQILLHQHVCFSFNVVLSVGAILKMQMVIEVPIKKYSKRIYVKIVYTPADFFSIPDSVLHIWPPQTLEVKDHFKNIISAPWNC